MDERKQLIEKLLDLYVDMEQGVLLNIIEGFLEEKDLPELQQIVAGEFGEEDE